MDIITVLRDMIDVRDGFKTCAYYTNKDIEYVINHICLNWNVKFTGFFLIVPLFLLQCVNKDIIIINLLSVSQIFRQGKLVKKYWNYVMIMQWLSKYM